MNKKFFSYVLIGFLSLSVLTIAKPFLLQAAYPDAPTFSLASGFYIGTQTLVLSASGANQIRYTTNGTNPTCSSGNIYNVPIKIGVNRVIKAIACYTLGSSAVSSSTYTFTATTPTIIPPSGKYTTSLNATIIANFATTIKYTTDGSIPTCSTGTTYSGPIGIYATTTLKAVACFGTGTSSSLLVRNYAVTPQPPTLSLGAGTYVTPQVMTMTAPGATTIRYTNNLAVKLTCTNGKEYTEPITILSRARNVPNNISFKAIACYAGGYISNPITTSFTVNQCSYGLRLNDDGVRSSLTSVKCFDPDWKDAIPLAERFEVYQNVAPPTSATDTSYKFHPVDVAYTLRRSLLTNSNTTVVGNVNKGLFIWANRCQKLSTSGTSCQSNNYEGNPVFGSTVSVVYRSFFSTVEKANACTYSQAAASMGGDETELTTLLTSKGLSIATTDSELLTASQLYDTTEEKLAIVGSQTELTKFTAETFNRTQPWIIDTCYVPEFDAGLTMVPYVNTVLLDYEVGDRRSTTEASQFLTDYTTKLKALNPTIKLVLFNNGWNLPGSEISGLTSTTTEAALAGFDRLVIWATPGAQCRLRTKTISQSLDDQINEITATGTRATIPKSKFLVVVDMLNDQSIGSEVRSYVLTNGLSGVLFFRNNTIQSSCNTSDPLSNVNHVVDTLNITPDY